jgi:hypothetical protein
VTVSEREHPVPPVVWQAVFVSRTLFQFTLSFEPTSVTLIAEAVPELYVICHVTPIASELPTSESGVQSPTAEVTALHDAVNVAGAYCCGVVAEADATKAMSSAIGARRKILGDRFFISVVLSAEPTV